MSFQFATKAFKSLVICLMVMSLAACGNQSATMSSSNEQQSPILEVKGDGDVHYEHVDENGTFVSHQTLTDPLGKTYQKGIAVANKLSTQKIIMDNGPIANRVDLVMVGDGYTAADMSKYESHAQNVLDSYFNQEPLKSYKNYFNVHRIDVVSNQSGVDNDPSKGVSKDTAMGMNFWCSGTERLLCINASKAKSFAANAPQVDQILALANSTKYGGAGYWGDGLATMSGGNSSAVELALHELAHSFAKLGDEYDYAGASSSECLAKANGSTLIASDMLSQQKKWWRWLDLSNVDTFKGTCYTSNGYRPTSDSKMRTLNKPFYEVNSEEYIFKIYGKVKPIDSSTAAGTYDQNVTLNVTPMQPIGYNLDLRWYVNGVEIPSAAQSQNLSVSTLGLSSGQHTIMAKVIDTTTRVRDEARRTSLMTQTKSWTINSTGGGGSNQLPLAVNDSASTQENVSVLINALGNDSDPDGDAISLNSVSAPTLGTAVIENGKVKYSPFVNKNGIDTFSYTIKDSKGAQASANISVNIGAVNSSPLANNDSVSTLPGTAKQVNVLANDSDPDGDTISLISVGQASYGQTYISGSSVVYTPNVGFEGTDVFSYTIKDAFGAEASAQVSVEVGNSSVIALNGLSTTASISTGKNSVGLKFTTSAAIRVSKIMFDGVTQQVSGNVAIYKYGVTTPIAVYSMSTAAGEYSVSTATDLQPGTYVIAVLAAGNRQSRVADLTYAPEISGAKGMKKYSNGTMVYPSTTESANYVYGNINFEFKK